jgi:phosphopantothenoylcysteine decarboxylase/phosphopantothenate--cysteine ligase
VTLVSGPVALPDPAGVRVQHVETAEQMLAACLAALPVEAAVFAAAVADWRVAEVAGSKLKKDPGGTPPRLHLVANPDILATIAAPGPQRPRLVVGFAAETEGLLAHAEEKRRRKNADWIVANDVRPESGVMGGAENEIHLLTAAGVEHWPRLAKEEVAKRLAARLAEALQAGQQAAPA